MDTIHQKILFNQNKTYSLLKNHKLILKSLQIFNNNIKN